MTRVLTACRLSSQTLKEWVAVESDSVQPVLRLRRELLRMMGLAADRLRNLGAHVDLVDTGFQQVLASPPASEQPLPGASARLPFVVAGWGFACPHAQQKQHRDSQ